MSNPCYILPLLARPLLLNANVRPIKEIARNERSVVWQGEYRCDASLEYLDLQVSNNKIVAVKIMSGYHYREALMWDILKLQPNIVPTHYFNKVIYYRNKIYTIIVVQKLQTYKEISLTVRRSNKFIAAHYKLLAHIHSLGFFIDDLKPSNILYDIHGMPLFIDLATFARADKHIGLSQTEIEYLTKNNKIELFKNVCAFQVRFCASMSTYMYASPESLEEHKQIRLLKKLPVTFCDTQKADVFAMTLSLLTICDLFDVQIKLKQRNDINEIIGFRNKMMKSIDTEDKLIKFHPGLKINPENRYTAQELFWEFAFDMQQTAGHRGHHPLCYLNPIRAKITYSPSQELRTKVIKSYLLLHGQSPMFEMRVFFLANNIFEIFYNRVQKGLESKVADNVEQWSCVFKDAMSVATCIYGMPVNIMTVIPYLQPPWFYLHNSVILAMQEPSLFDFIEPSWSPSYKCEFRRASLIAVTKYNLVGRADIITQRIKKYIIKQQERKKTLK